MNIIKEIQSLKCSLSNIFNNLTLNQAKQISNALNNIVDAPLYYYAYNIGNNIFKFLIDETPLTINNTLGNQRVAYSLQEPPYTVKVAESINPNLPLGKYIFIESTFDGINYQKIFKSLTKDTVIGTYSTSSTIGVKIENIGQELIVAQPFNILVDNNTNKNSTIVGSSPYYSKSFPLTDNTTVQTEQYTLWDYLSLQVRGFSMIGESQSIRLTIWDDVMLQQYGSVTFNAGTDYSGGNYGFGYIDPNGGTRNFKLIVEYI